MKKRNRRQKIFSFVIVVLACCFSFPALGEGEPRPDLTARRDPFVPLLGVDSAKTRRGIEGIFSIVDVKFQGTATGVEGQKAIVLNGEIIQEGETVGLVKIEKVGESSATIFIDGRPYELSLYEYLSQ